MPTSHRDVPSLAVMALTQTLRTARTELESLLGGGSDAEAVVVLHRTIGRLGCVIEGIERGLEPPCDNSLAADVWLFADRSELPGWIEAELEGCGSRIVDRASSPAGRPVVVLYDATVDPTAPVWMAQSRRAGETPLSFVGLSDRPGVHRSEAGGVLVWREASPDELHEAFRWARTVAQRPVKSHPVPIGRSQPVLVVEGDQQLRLRAAAMLRELGFTPRTANTVRQARDMMAVQRYRLVLLDVELLRGEGRGELHLARRDEATRHEASVPIVAVMEAEMTLPAPHLSGFAAQFYRPWDLEELRGVVERHLDRRPVLQVIDPDLQRRTGLVDMIQQLGQAHVLSEDPSPETTHHTRRWQPDLVFLAPTSHDTAWEPWVRALAAAAVPLVAIIGPDDVEAERRALDAGCIDVLRTPLDRESVWMVLRGHIAPWHALVAQERPALRERRTPPVSGSPNGARRVG